MCWFTGRKGFANTLAAAGLGGAQLRDLYGLDSSWCRLAVGTRADNERLVEKLRQILPAAAGGRSRSVKPGKNCQRVLGKKRIESDAELCYTGQCKRRVNEKLPRRKGAHHADSGRSAGLAGLINTAVTDSEERMTQNSMKPSLPVRSG